MDYTAAARPRREGRAFDPAIVEGLAPGGVEVALDIGLGVRDHSVVRGDRGVKERLNDIVRAVAGNLADIGHDDMRTLDTNVGSVFGHDPVTYKFRRLELRHNKK